MHLISKDRLLSKVLLAVFAGGSVFLAFPKFGFWPIIFLFPLFLNWLISACENFWEGFIFGFITSFVVMLGGFYWVIYVIHEFGYFPWPLAILTYLGFCGFGALNFPLFVGIATQTQKWFHIRYQKPVFVYFWFSLALPALFTIIEHFIPKLFPWYVSHCFYKVPPITQIAELTGETFLTFALYSLPSTIGVILFARSTQRKNANPTKKKVIDLATKQPLEPQLRYLLVPAACWIAILAFGGYRLHQSHSTQPSLRPLNVAIVQANIGSLEKVEAKRGIAHKVKKVISSYVELTEKAVNSDTPPDLIVWPETAVPFYLKGQGTYTQEIHNYVRKWKIPLLTGGYSPDLSTATLDFNSAFLLESQEDSTDLKIQTYHKNVLLAFGEYMPLGGWFPILYKWFGEVSLFARGTEQKVFLLSDKEIRLGITICYEAIIPSFVRKVAKKGMHAHVNLTNDSWFGPTAEPYLHGAISIFRAIETRTPLIRSTNTGTSFVVDRWGRISKMTPVYEPALLQETVWLPASPPATMYLKWGDWFILVCFLFIAIPIKLRKRYASVSD